MDPEQSKKFSDKSDIYSFGVVLLELITGREPIHEGINIVDWARDQITQAADGQYTTFIDSKLRSYNEEEMQRMISCAAHCVYKSSKYRPRMKEIVLALEGYIPPNSIDNLLQPMVQKLPIISEIDDDDTVGFQVCKPRIFTYQQLERATQEKMAKEGQVIACHTVQAWTEQLEKAQKTKQLIVVDFTASWCPPSVFMRPILAELAKNMPNVTFLMVDVDELRSVAFDWAVEALPTFLFLKEGKIVDKVVGANKEQLQLTIARHVHNQFLQSTNAKTEKMAEEGQVTACHTVQAWTEQLEKAQKSKQLTVVDFTASWCPPSVLMSPILAELAKNMPNVTFLMVDVDELRSVAFDWAVEVLPTFLLLKEGKIVGKVVGANKEQLQLTIARHVHNLQPKVSKSAISPETNNVIMPGQFPNQQWATATNHGFSNNGIWTSQVHNPHMFSYPTTATNNGFPVNMPGTLYASIKWSQGGTPNAFTYETIL
ncbi:hypothetical protein GH714_035204 [Hevea brasiliensis]|uniref:Thioredoxin domain-containing protein n=1 Tax=Hevea brasiliensis TaxID=3981 RepID=A0A6A6NB36_HEVBR|nr:hypothetical protein GH714_035204 [Hevea brasiliensis]